MECLFPETRKSYFNDYLKSRVCILTWRKSILTQSLLNEFSSWSWHSYSMNINLILSFSHHLKTMELTFSLVLLVWSFQFRIHTCLALVQQKAKYESIRKFFILCCRIDFCLEFSTGFHRFQATQNINVLWLIYCGEF